MNPSPDTPAPSRVTLEEIGRLQMEIEALGKKFTELNGQLIDLKAAYLAQEAAK